MLCLLGMMFVLASMNLAAKLVLELELSTFLDTLKLHSFEHTIVLVHRELGFKKLSGQLKGLGVKFHARCDELVAVIFVEQHVEPLKR
jgi:hypothetical protein